MWIQHSRSFTLDPAVCIIPSFSVGSVSYLSDLNEFHVGCRYKFCVLSHVISDAS